MFLVSTNGTIGTQTIVEIDEKTQSTTVNYLNEEDYKLWLEHYTVSELWDKNIIGGRFI